MRGSENGCKLLVRKEGLEPSWVTPPDPKSGASANSATFARLPTPRFYYPFGRLCLGVLSVETVRLSIPRTIAGQRQSRSGGSAAWSTALRRSCRGRLSGSRHWSHMPAHSPMISPQVRRVNTLCGQSDKLNRCSLKISRFSFHPCYCCAEASASW